MISLSLSISFLIWTVIKRRRISELVATGKQGTAFVLSLSDTGVKIDDDPRVKLELEISIPNYLAYKAWKTATIPIIYLPQV